MSNNEWPRCSLLDKLPHPVSLSNAWPWCSCHVYPDWSPLLLFLEFLASGLNSRLKTLQVTAAAAPGFIRDIGADKVEFKFRKPKSIKIGGSYAFQGIAKPDVNVDLLVGLPKVLHLLVGVVRVFLDLV